MNALSGKVAVIPSGNSGIGFATAKRLVKEGGLRVHHQAMPRRTGQDGPRIGNVRGHDLSKLLGILHDLWHEFSTAVFETQLLNRFVPSVECT